MFYICFLIILYCRLVLLKAFQIIIFLSEKTCAAKYKSDAKCPNGESYAPCTCSTSGAVSCHGVSMTKVKKVLTAKTKAADLDALHLWPTDPDGIPENLLGNKRVKNILIFCPVDDKSYRLYKIHSEAFSSSINFTVELNFRNCDLNQLDLSFLKGFGKLQSLKMSKCNNIHRIRWDSTPSLPKLSKLEMLSCMGLNEWTSFPRPRLLKGGLYEMKLNLVGINDDAADRILAWTLKHSAESLHKLEIAESFLTRIPKQLISFTKLHHLDLQGQSGKLGVLRAGELAFSTHFTRLSLNNCGINIIEPYAIQGKVNVRMINEIINILFLF